MTGLSAANSGSKANVVVSPSPKKNVERPSLRAGYDIKTAAGRFLLAPNMSNSLEKYKKQYCIVKDISENQRNIN